MGMHWFRRGVQSLKCMSSLNDARKSLFQFVIVANDDNYALAA